MLLATKPVVLPEHCPAVARDGDHMYVVIYFRHWLRKHNSLRCWKCDLRINEP